MFKQMSLFSKILKAKFGIPEVNLNKNPLTKMFLDDYTEEQFKAILRELPKENLEQIVKVAQEIIKEKKNAQKS
jgi:hypothetical protein